MGPYSQVTAGLFLCSARRRRGREPPFPQACGAGGQALWCLNLECMCVCEVVSTLCHPMDCSPPGSSVHGILQAGILEWVALPSSRGSSPPRD